jgi:hypothetical protein
MKSGVPGQERRNNKNAFSDDLFPLYRHTLADEHAPGRRIVPQVSYFRAPWLERWDACPRWKLMPRAGFFAKHLSPIFTASGP